MGPTGTTRRLLLSSAAAGAACWRWDTPLGFMDSRVEEGVRVRIVLVDDEVVVGWVAAVLDDAVVVGHGVDERTVRVSDIATIQIAVLDVFLSAVLVVLGVIAVIIFAFLVLLSTLSSCPYVYVRRRDGTRALAGEAYPGAAVGALRRWDVLALPDVGGGPFALELENDPDEVDYTDAVELWWVDHAADERVLPTHEQALVRVGSIAAAEEVIDGEGVDRTAVVKPGAGRGWGTDLDRAAARKPVPESESLTARFANAPDGAALELWVRNSPWLDFLADQAWLAYGERLGDVQGRNRDPELAAHRLAQLRAAGIHTRIEVLEGEGWREVGYVPPVGWTVARRVVVPLGVPAGRPVTVRLTAGVGFLLVHEVGLASVRGPATPHAIGPTSARSIRGEDVLTELSTVDGAANELRDPGERTTLDFDLPAAPEAGVRTVFLRIHGWYEARPQPEARRRPQVFVAIGSPEHFSAAGLEAYRQLRKRLKQGVPT